MAIGPSEEFSPIVIHDRVDIYAGNKLVGQGNLEMNPGFPYHGRLHLKELIESPMRRSIDYLKSEKRQYIVEFQCDHSPGVILVKIIAAHAIQDIKMAN